MPTTEHEHGPLSPSYRDLLRAYDRAWQSWEANPSPHTFAVLQTGIEFLYWELAKPGKFDLERFS